VFIVVFFWSLLYVQKYKSSHKGTLIIISRKS